MKDITDVDYAQAKKVCKDSDIFENFRNVCLKIYELDSEKFLSDPGLAWQTVFKKTKVKFLLISIPYSW